MRSEKLNSKADLLMEKLCFEKTHQMKSEIIRKTYFYLSAGLLQPRLKPKPTVEINCTYMAFPTSNASHSTMEEPSISRQLLYFENKPMLAIRKHWPKILIGFSILALVSIIILFIYIL